MYLFDMRKALLYMFFLSQLFSAGQEDGKIQRIDSALQQGFKAKADNYYKIYQQDSVAARIPKNAVMAARFIYINYDNKDSIPLLKKDIKNKVPIKTIIKKYHLKEDDDYVNAYALDALFLQPYYNKICFTSHLRLSRNDLVMDNTPCIKNRSQIDSGMYFINHQNEDKIELMCFYEKYKPHTLPSYLNDALHYYQTLTQSKTPVYTMAYRLNIKPQNKDGVILDSLWTNYPAKPIPPVSSAYSIDSVMVKQQLKNLKIYGSNLTEWEKNRTENFNRLVKTDSIFKQAYQRYSLFIKNYSVIEYNQLTMELLHRFGITNRLTSYYARHTSAAFYRIHDLYMDSAIKYNNYGLFAKTFYYTQVRGLNRENQAKLDSLRKMFFKDLNKMYVGQLANVILKSPNLMMRQTLGTNYCYHEETLRNQIEQIQTHLKTNPKDELMNYYLCVLYETMLDDVKDADKEEEWFEKYLKENPAVELWLDY